MSGKSELAPNLLGIICNWCCYGGADLCGVSRLQYPPHIRLIRVMCSARVDLSHIFKAFSVGIDGVFIGGCHLNDCHYITHGNFHALSLVKICKRLMEQIGIHPDRLRLEWVSAGEGIRFASIMNEFSPRVQKLGPLGKAEGLEEHELKLRLEAAERLIPYIKLVERERLRAPAHFKASPDPEEEYEKFFNSAETVRIFNETIGEKLAISRIVSVLREKALSTGEMAEALRLTPSEVSRHLKTSTKQGIVRFDNAAKRYALA